MIIEIYDRSNILTVCFVFCNSNILTRISASDSHLTWLCSSVGKTNHILFIFLDKALKKTQLQYPRYTHINNLFGASSKQDFNLNLLVFLIFSLFFLSSFFVFSVTNSVKNTVITLTNVSQYSNILYPCFSIVSLVVIVAICDIFIPAYFLFFHKIIH